MSGASTIPRIPSGMWSRWRNSKWPLGMSTRRLPELAPERSWTNATTTLAAAITLSAAGDDFNVLLTHAETQASALTLTFKGTATSPNRVFSCDNTNSPAQASDLLAGASVTTTGNSNLTLSGNDVYIYGVTFNCGTGAVAALINVSSLVGTLEACALNKLGTAGSATAIVSNTGSGNLVLLNTPMKFGSTSDNIRFDETTLLWRNTPNAIAGSTYPTTLFGYAGTAPSLIQLDGVDLSALGSGNIFGTPPAGRKIQLLNCKTGSSAVIATTPSAPGAIVDLINSDSGATGSRQERYTYQGTLTTSTTIYNNASDGVTPISWQVVTTANSKLQAPFECFQIPKWAGVGTFANTFVTITSATASLTNADVWMEAEYLGTSGFPISSLTTSGVATQLTAGSGLASGAWGTGARAHTYTLALPSFTTAIAGYVRFTVKVAKASLTLNIDPNVSLG